MYTIIEVVASHNPSTPHCDFLYCTLILLSVERQIRQLIAGSTYSSATVPPTIFCYHYKCCVGDSRHILNFGARMM